MNPALQQFVSVALPIMVTLVATIWLASWSQNKRFDDLSKRFDDINKRFDDHNDRFDDLTTSINRRFDDLRADMAARFGEVNRRIDELVLR